MTEEQKKAIDACKDQAAKKLGYNDLSGTYILQEIGDLAMQLYGEQCRKEGYAKGHADGENYDPTMPLKPFKN
jgi:hypothetical protein